MLVFDFSVVRCHPLRRPAVYLVPTAAPIQQRSELLFHLRAGRRISTRQPTVRRLRPPTTHRRRALGGIRQGTYSRPVVDLQHGFRVLVVGEGPRVEDRAKAVESHGWQGLWTSDGSVRAAARSFLPHATLIDAVDVEAAAAAGLAVRAGGPYNAALLFVTSDDALREELRARVPVPTFVTEKTYMGELWQLAAAVGEG